MASFHELKAKTPLQPEITIQQGGYFGWEIAAAVREKEAERETARHPIPHPSPFEPRPVSFRAVEEAIARSHASGPSHRDLRRTRR